MVFKVPSDSNHSMIFIAPWTIHQPQSQGEPIFSALGAHTISWAKPCHPPPLSLGFWLLLCAGSALSSAASEGTFRAMRTAAMGTAAEDHAGARTAHGSSKSIALSPKSTSTWTAASPKFGKEKPRGKMTARRSWCEGKDCGKASRAQPEERSVTPRRQGQAEGDSAVRRDGRSTERSRQGEIYAAREQQARRTSAKGAT